MLSEAMTDALVVLHRDPFVQVALARVHENAPHLLSDGARRMLDAATDDPEPLAATTDGPLPVYSLDYAETHGSITEVSLLTEWEGSDSKIGMAIGRRLINEAASIGEVPLDAPDRDRPAFEWPVPGRIVYTFENA